MLERHGRLYLKNSKSTKVGKRVGYSVENYYHNDKLEENML